MAKLFASRMAEQVTSKVIEVYGDTASPANTGREVLPRPGSRPIYEGTSNMQLWSFAKQLLGRCDGAALPPGGELLDRFASPDPTRAAGRRRPSRRPRRGPRLHGLRHAEDAHGPPSPSGPGSARGARLAGEAGERLRRSVEKDARAYERWSRAYRLSKGTDGDKAARKSAIAAAWAGPPDPARKRRGLPGGS